jgi:hypothetical protein
MCHKHEYGSVTSPLTEVRVASPHASGGEDFNYQPTHPVQKGPRSYAAQPEGTLSAPCHVRMVPSGF